MGDTKTKEIVGADLDEISGVDFPATQVNGWLLVKSREGQVSDLSIEDLISQAEAIEKGSAAPLKDQLETAARGYLADAPEDVKAACNTLHGHLTAMEGENGAAPGAEGEAKPGDQKPAEGADGTEQTKPGAPGAEGEAATGEEKRSVVQRLVDWFSRHEKDLSKAEGAQAVEADLIKAHPIPEAAQLSAAIDACNCSGQPEDMKRHVLRRARALGATDMLPDDWNVNKGLVQKHGQGTDHRPPGGFTPAPDKQEKPSYGGKTEPGDDALNAAASTNNPNFGSQGETSDRATHSAPSRSDEPQGETPAYKAAAEAFLADAAAAMSIEEPEARHDAVTKAAEAFVWELGEEEVVKQYVEQLTKAIEEAAAPVTKSLSDDIDAVKEAIGKTLERLENVEKATATQRSIPGQDFTPVNSSRKTPVTKAEGEGDEAKPEGWGPVVKELVTTGRAQLGQGR